MTVAARLAAIHRALLLVAENVAKHIIQRDGFHQDDPCFRVDLREAEQGLADSLSAGIEEAVLAERQRCADLARAEMIHQYNLDLARQVAVPDGPVDCQLNEAIGRVVAAIEKGE